MESIEGGLKGQEIQLDLDNGLVCPNITYDSGNRYLVFLRKLRTGHFETYNTYFGAYRVRNGTVINWEFRAETKLDSVRAGIRKNLK